MSSEHLGVHWICEMLYSLGATHVFGLPGTQNLPFVEALRTSELRFVAQSSELAASFAANGFARSSGRTAVLATIAGPGFTYALSGIAEARQDSAPLLFLVFADDSHADRRFRLQSLPLESIAAAFAKAVYSVSSVDQLEHLLPEAYRVTQEEEPGPVVVIIYRSVATASMARSKTELAPSHSPSTDSVNFQKAIARIAGASRLFVIAGQGSANSSKELLHVVGRMQALAFLTASGRGVIPDNHSQLLRVDFSSAKAGVVNRALESADVILTLGAKLSHNGSGGFALKLDRDKHIRVDTSAEVLGADYPASIAIQASVSEFLRELSEHLGTELRTGWSEDLLNEFRSLTTEINSRDDSWEFRGRDFCKPSDFFALLQQSIPNDTIYVADAGYHQTLVRKHCTISQPRTLIVPADFQSMGFSIPAALGAAIANPSRSVVAFVGDGGLMITAGEIAHAVALRLPLKIIAFCDGLWGSIAQQQISYSGRTFGVNLPEFDPEALAAAVSAEYLLANSADSSAIREVLASPSTSLIVVQPAEGSAYRAQRRRAALQETARTILPSSLRKVLKLAAEKFRQRGRRVK